MVRHAIVPFRLERLRDELSIVISGNKFVSYIHEMENPHKKPSSSPSCPPENGNKLFQNGGQDRQRWLEGFYLIFWPIKMRKNSDSPRNFKL